VEGHRACGVVRFFAGEFQSARDHLERGIALYDSQAHGRNALRYGEDPGEVCLSYLARTLWILGYPRQALECSEKAIAVAHETSHAASIAEAMIWRAELALLHQEAQEARMRTAAVFALMTEHGPSVWTGIARSIRGSALVEEGQCAEGIGQIREGLSELAEIGEPLFRPYFIATLAEALGKSGQMDEGLSTIDEAIDWSCRSGMHYWDSELRRRKGELLLASDGTDRAAAEVCFRQAIEIAQAQGAKSLNLRATTSLTRLLARQGVPREAHDLLAPVYGWFTEGLGTADLKHAKALLDELQSLIRKSSI
jgi:predicted ATPase